MWVFQAEYESQLRAQDLKEVMRCILWSDPCPNELGVAPNTRGAGVLFGSDVAQEFLSTNNLSMGSFTFSCRFIQSLNSIKIIVWCNESIEYIYIYIYLLVLVLVCVFMCV